MAHAEKELARSSHQCLPVTDPATDQLIGILSASDILRARAQAQQLLGPGHTRNAAFHNGQQENA
jgi:CBS domain containing-hemolysin-like protein